jgi:D-beta-D-heptose 7-phosphate kinase/D-beta-D-heptose 1-phosphate adenosyltransferase
LGDALVVAVNTDDSVRRLGKGVGRPLVPERDRALVLAALSSVDAVCLFAEDTPRELLSGLLPDVLVKGGDYAPHSVVGRDEVEAAGGRVELIPFVEGYSTTELVRRIQGTQW